MPMTLSVTNITLATEGTTVMYTDSCNYDMPPTSTANPGLKKIKLSPNPANDIVQITENNIEEIKVIDALGRIVLSAPANTRELIVAQLPNGIYTICIKINGSSYHDRLMLLH